MVLLNVGGESCQIVVSHQWDIYVSAFFKSFKVSGEFLITSNSNIQFYSCGNTILPHMPFYPVGSLMISCNTEIAPVILIY
jgi:hypothetical protein